ncbi:MAG: hypothetical protein KAZ77_01385, partial [Acidovorax sp.]|nr:hypothetical protein [Acidovorax sp.]
MNEPSFAAAGRTPFRGPFRFRAAFGFLGVTSAVALLAGCASLVSPDSRLPQTPVPSAWSVQPPSGSVGLAQPVTPLAQWWQRFNDPQLTQLVTQTLQSNTSLRSAQASLQQARA